jgi:DNA transposition AAA+ family ATPase
MITTELKERILKEVQRRRTLFEGSDAKFAISLGINNAQYSRIKNGELDRVLSDANWISIARRLEVNISDAPEWKTAETPVFKFISKQLEVCQQGCLSSLLCDLSDIGKTYTARYYVKTHKNAIYIDCSQVKTKQKLIRQIAKSFGAGSTGRYADVYEDLVFYLKTLPAPLIILDEAGDLQYDAFLEIKALWNATDKACAYYMMGADGLREKIRRSIDNKKVGYAEMFSRFGKRYGKVIPVSGEEKTKMLQVTAAMIIKANAPDADVNRVLKGAMGDDNTPSLRRVYTEIVKLN